MDSRHPTSLHHSLLSSLRALSTKHNVPRTFALTTLRSQPYRTYTLFPHASDPNLVVLRTDILVILAEQFSLDSPVPDSVSQMALTTVPVFALEASLYTIPATAVELLYVSKIDTTGLAPLPAPAAQLTVAFLAHFVDHRPRSIHSLRIHVFARAAREGQYLFPGSVENVRGGTAGNEGCVALAGKRLLDDQQLVRWWHKILSQLAGSFGGPPRGPLQAFYILPGFDYEESRAVLPVPPNAARLWTYGHPYATVPSPVASGAGPHSVAELVPAFSDDPKARFLHSLGGCVAAPAGEPGDWDDAISERAPAALEADRVRERARMRAVGADEFWVRMGGRQECCDGRLSAFFVLATPSAPVGRAAGAGPGRDDARSTCSNASTATTGPSDTPRKQLATLPRNVWVSLWSKIHNQDYAKLEAAATGYQGWLTDVEACVAAELGGPRGTAGDQAGSASRKPVEHSLDWHSVIVVDNPSEMKGDDGQKSKRVAEKSEEKQMVTMLMPRKKMKKSIQTCH